MDKTIFDPEWPHGYMTKGGRLARIVCRGLLGAYSIGVAVKSSAFEERLDQVNLLGESSQDNPLKDLVNAPEPPTQLWVAQTHGGEWRIYTEEPELNRIAPDGLARFIPIEIEPSKKS